MKELICGFLLLFTVGCSSEGDIEQVDNITNPIEQNMLVVNEEKKAEEKKLSDIKIEEDKKKC
ncbi:MAG: hypothetical protein Q9M97_08015 [Candidatus Gracilibacteria bacterium]|nr:hypothetical protein [Candidatus Gracilibacteria bacterium]